MTTRSSTPAPRKDPQRRGTWYYVFESVHPRPDGSRRQLRRRGFTTRSAAQEALALARRNDAQGAAPGGELTVGAVFDDFVRTKRLQGRAPNTVAQYEWAAGIAKAHWGGWEAARLTTEVIEGVYEALAAGGRRQYRRGQGTEATAQPMSPRSVAAFHTALKAALQLAVDRGHLLRNPAVMATLAAVREQRREWWTPEQVAAFLGSLADAPLVVTGLAEVLVDTGGRRGEVLGLRWADLDLDAGSTVIRQQLCADPRTKVLAIRATKRPRAKSTIALHPATVTVLRARRSEAAADRLRMGAGWPQAGTVADDLVFTWPDGRPVHPDVLTRTVRRRALQLGLPLIGAHGLRHAFAAAALAARVPVEVVAARLGNTPRMVQEVYQHVIPADDAAAAQVVGDLYRRPASL